MPGTTRLTVIGLIAGLVLLVAFTVAASGVNKLWKSLPGPGAPETPPATRWGGPDRPDTICLRPEVVEALDVRVAWAEPERGSRPLELSGSLAWDPDRLAPVRSRFPGEVVEIGEVRDPDAAGPTRFRPVRVGDHVQEGQLLAVVWSKDLGQTKSTLMDALSKLRLDQETLQRYDELYRRGGLPERSLREAERNVQADKIAVEAVELTLRSWRLTDREIAAIKREAEELADLIRKKEAEEGKEEVERRRKDWPRVEVRAPIAGVILEKNVANVKAGAVVDTSTNLFYVGDLSRLMVLANAYEDELPTLQLLPRPIRWSIRLKAEPNAPPLEGTVSEIRPVIDPTMHTALVRGFVDNPGGRLAAGQFVTATISFPPMPCEVAVPSPAVDDDGEQSVVFVESRPDRPDQRCYTLRRVAVVRRGRDRVQLRWFAPQFTLPALLPVGPAGPFNAALAVWTQGTQVQPGQRVVTAGALELRAELKERRDAEMQGRK